MFGGRLFGDFYFFLSFGIGDIALVDVVVFYLEFVGCLVGLLYLLFVLGLAGQFDGLLLILLSLEDLTGFLPGLDESDADDNDEDNHDYPDGEYDLEEHSEEGTHEEGGDDHGDDLPVDYWSVCQRVSLAEAKQHFDGLPEEHQHTASGYTVRAAHAQYEETDGDEEHSPPDARDSRQTGDEEDQDEVGGVTPVEALVDLFGDALAVHTVVDR